MMNEQEKKKEQNRLLLKLVFGIDTVPDSPIDPERLTKLKKAMDDVLSTLTEREEKIMQLRFGIGGNDFPRTLEEVGSMFNITRDRVRQIETQALNKLRHPARRKKLIEFME